MNRQDREKILNQMSNISDKVDESLEAKTQERGNIIFFGDFEFKGSGLAAKNVHIVEINNQKQTKTANKTVGLRDIYQIYSEEGELIATVSEDGKIHFTPEYLEQLKSIDERYFEQLDLENLEFELPEDLSENDLAITKEELEENKQLERGKDGRANARDDENGALNKEEQEEKEPEEETEEEKKEKTAQALGIDIDEIRSICTINPQEKITDKANLVDIMPEAAVYKEISIVCSNPNDKSHGEFTVIGITQDGTRELLNSIEPVEGTSTSNNVISVNEDGSKVTEKQVKGLFAINSRGRTDGISISIGNYGMMEVDYVSNIWDKETRRATPIRTKEAQNQRVTTAKVRENAGDHIEEVDKEGENFRKRQEEGIDPQTLDGVDIDEADGQGITLEELKEQIKEDALDKGDMSRAEIQEFIREKIEESGLQLSDEEIENTTEEIHEEVLDESRFPTRE